MKSKSKQKQDREQKYPAWPFGSNCAWERDGKDTPSDEAPPNARCHGSKYTRLAAGELPYLPAAEDCHAAAMATLWENDSATAAKDR